METSLTKKARFTATSDSPILDLSLYPPTLWAIQVVGEGAAATAWTVAIQVSLDGVTFTSILTHAETDGDGVTVFHTDPRYGKFMRVSCSALTLGGATAINVFTFGTKF